ncbi:MAG TPA: sigma-70 family RNA polymerase sigma factor [Acidimicrobiales bacterium]|nr:sigma-70 family RNA polymerase sigma factor [Acidimicrobiales bacterium]
MSLLPPLSRSLLAIGSDRPATAGARSDVDAGDVYRMFGPSVRGYLRGQGVDDPDDLLGEVFFQVTRSLPRFEGDDDDLRRWLFTIARNRVIDARRRRSRRPRTVALGSHDVEVDAPDEPDEELIAAMGALTDEQREVIALRFIADLPLEDVAHLTGRTVGATKSMQHRALDQLARRLDGPGEGA